MRCGNCDCESPDGMSVCGMFGARLANFCSRCGFENPPQFALCGSCGTSLAAGAPGTGADRAFAGISAAQHRSTSAAAPAESAQAPEGERKIVTALFADIKDSTALMEDLDPEHARGPVEPALPPPPASMHPC